MKRRNFIQQVASISLIPSLSPLNNIIKSPFEDSIKFGICADVHQDIIFDAEKRLKEFIEVASERNLDFIIQLGDFCIPKPSNLNFMSIWNSYSGKRYHVLGNHDTDGGFTREQTVDFWKAEAKYYSFDLKGYHFIVLDGNEADSSKDRPSGYNRYISEQQLDWLEKDLASTKLPTIVFCHQGLDNDLGGITNSTSCRVILEKGNVKLVFSGHHHQDYMNIINGIQYVQINSMSYHWVGAKYQHQRYNDSISKNFPNLKNTIPYKNPLYAFAEITTSGQFLLEGKLSQFVEPGPEELGITRNAYPIVPKISNRDLKLNK